MIKTIILALCLLLVGCADYSLLFPNNERSVFINETEPNKNEENVTEQTDSIPLPTYDGEPYIEYEGNIPSFEGVEFNIDMQPYFSELDLLGRTQQAYAVLSADMLYYGERESISNIRPSGWHTVRYDDLITDKWLYNRCHLIANVFYQYGNVINNLITGTRYMNVEGMLPFEIQIAQYLKDTGNHVLYCVTPIYEGVNLVASGVQIEAMSYEDAGETLQFNVYCFNVQPNIEIDYLTGESWRLSE